MVIRVQAGMIPMKVQDQMAVMVLMTLTPLVLLHNVVYVKEMEHLVIMMIHLMILLKIVAMILKRQRERLQMRKHIWQSNSTELIIR